MKQLKKIVSYALLFVMLVVCVPETAYAKSMSVSFSGGGQYSVGDTFTVNFATTGEGSYVAEGTINYDPAILSCTNASGTIRFTSNSGSIVSSVGAGSVTFTCIGTGSTTISASNVTGYDIETMEDLEVMAGTAQITVVPKETPAPLSSDASLNGLLTSLGQVNAADGAWTLTCGHEVTTFAINPTVAAGAKWSATGDFNNLREGENHFSIIVTAEDGVTQKTYPITVIRAAAPQTSAPSTTAPTEPTTEEPSSEEETSSEAEEVLVAELISGKVLNVAESLEGIELPEGYEKIIYNYEGAEIEAASADNGVVLLYLTDEDGANGTFYVYNEETKLCAPFVTIEAKDALLVLPFPKDVELPENYEEIELTLGNNTVTAWALEGEENYCLVYGVYQDGEEGFYRYDREEGTFLRYQADGASDVSLEELQKKNQELAAKYEQDMQLRLIWIIVLAVICLILLVIVIILLVKRNKKNDTPPSDPKNTKEMPAIPSLFEDDEEELEDWDETEEPVEDPVDDEENVLGESGEPSQEEEEETPVEEIQELLEEEMEAIPQEEQETKDSFDKDMFDFEASIEEILRQSFPERMEDWMNLEKDAISENTEQAEETIVETPVAEEPVVEAPVEEEPVAEAPVTEEVVEALAIEKLPVEELFEEETVEIPVQEVNSVVPPMPGEFAEEELFADEEESVIEKPSPEEELTASDLYGETKVDGVDIEEDLDVYFSQKPEKKAPKKAKKAVPKQEAPAADQPDDDGFEFIEF